MAKLPLLIKLEKQVQIYVLISTQVRLIQRREVSEIICKNIFADNFYDTLRNI